MQFTFALCLVVLSVLVEPIYNVKICISRVRTCNDNVPVCGRFGRSNLCMRFKNRCDLEVKSCISTAEYTPVSNVQCTGIPLNKRRACYGRTNNNNPNGRPGFWEGYKPGGWYNAAQTNAKVKPIVINVGK